MAHLLNILIVTLKCKKMHEIDHNRVLKGQGGNLAGEGTCQQARQPEFDRGPHTVGENEPEPTVLARGYTRKQLPLRIR